MGKPNERKRQKQREKQKRKRDKTKQAAQQAKPVEALGAVGEFGPAWISSSYDDPEQPSALVTIMCTRRVSGRLLVGATVLVDRTCLGIKNAYMVGPTVEHEIADHVEQLGRFDPMLPCDPLVAQSVVFHALDYARSLGFEPHRDFDRRLFEPRPSTLLETPSARRKRPLYVPGPNDRSDAIRRKLDAAVGPDNYDFVLFDTDDFEMDDFEPLEDPLEPADRGAVAGRIDWRRACIDVPFSLPFEQLELDHEGLEMSPEHKASLAELGIRKGDVVRWIDDQERPGEPW